MTIPILKLKIIPKPIVKGKMDVRFPGRVFGTGGISVIKENGDYTISPTLGVLGDVTGPGAGASVAGEVAVFTDGNNIVSSGIPYTSLPQTFDSLELALVSTIGDNVNEFIVFGYSDVGDGGFGKWTTSSGPAAAGKRQHTDGSWWLLDETLPNELMLGGVSTATNAAQTAAIQELLDYCALYKRKAHLLAAHTITAQINVPAGVTVEWCGGKTIAAAAAGWTKGFNGDMISLGNTAQLINPQLTGAGATFTGRGVVIAAGANGHQAMYDPVIVDMAGACLEFPTGGEGQFFFCANGKFQRNGAGNPCIIMPATEGLAGGARTFVNPVCTDGGTLFKFNDGQMTKIYGGICGLLDYTGNTTGRVWIFGMRIGGACTIFGTEHHMSGCTMGVSLTLGAGATYCDLSDNIIAGDLDVVDNSGNATNRIGVYSSGKKIKLPITTVPATPAAGYGLWYFDQTDARLHDINAAGTIATTVVPASATSNQFLTNINSAGTQVKAQPAFTDISGTVTAAQGGTGVANNVASTITISGNFGTTFTVSATTSLILPTSGTLATLAGTEELDNKTLDSSVGKGTWTASGTWTLPSLTLAGTTTMTGAFDMLVAANVGVQVRNPTGPVIQAIMSWNGANGGYFQLNDLAGALGVLFQGQGDSYTLKGWGVGTSTAPGTGNLKVAGHIQTKAPVSSATNYTMLAGDSSIIFTNSGGSSTLTLLAASSYVGRDLWLKTTEAQAVVSAGSNVVPRAGGAAGTAILPATDGAWAYLKSDGTNWVIMASGV